MNEASREASHMVATDHMAGKGNSEKVEKLRAPEKVHLGTGWHLKGKDRRKENRKYLVPESGLRETGTSKRTSWWFWKGAEIPGKEKPLISLKRILCLFCRLKVDLICTS